MKKNLIIVFLTIVSFASLTYGYFQKERADEQEAIAEQSRKEAEMQREVAMTNEQKARENEQRARENEQKANEQIAIALKALDEEKEKLIEQFSADKFSNIGEWLTRWQFRLDNTKTELGFVWRMTHARPKFLTTDKSKDQLLITGETQQLATACLCQLGADVLV